MCKSYPTGLVSKSKKGAGGHFGTISKFKLNFSKEGFPKLGEKLITDTFGCEYTVIIKKKSEFESRKGVKLELWNNNLIVTPWSTYDRLT